MINLLIFNDDLQRLKMIDPQPEFALQKLLDDYEDNLRLSGEVKCP